MKVPSTPRAASFSWYMPPDERLELGERHGGNLEAGSRKVEVAKGGGWAAIVDGASFFRPTFYPAWPPPATSGDEAGSNRGTNHG
jgi:hypothetical protein